MNYKRTIIILMTGIFNVINSGGRTAYIIKDARSHFILSAPINRSPYDPNMPFPLLELKTDHQCRTAVFGCATDSSSAPEFQQMSCEKFAQTQSSPHTKRLMREARHSFSCLKPEETSIGLLIPNDDVDDVDDVDDGLMQSASSFIQTVTKIIHGFIMKPEDAIVNPRATLEETLFFITILLQRLSNDHAAKEYFKNYCEESPFPANHLEGIKEKARLAHKDTCCLKPDDYYSSIANSVICDKCKIPLHDYYKLRCAQELIEKSLSLGLGD